ncbi:AAA family ATPase [Streptomyces sp. NPDC090127]|uniref:AAA family ATPase n=1 Tax=Streptomyces sp. NPDC090127 TaxID=3365953 RepID=UPI0038278971
MTELVVGRGAQWAVLREALASVRESGRALWLCGEAGSGKTLLLDRLAEAAGPLGQGVLRVAGTEAEEPLRVAGAEGEGSLRAAGTEAEGSLRVAGAEAEGSPFGALRRLLAPLMDHAGHLPTAHHAALRQLRGRQTTEGPATATGTRAVSFAALALLGHVAQDRPLLVLVDDLHRADAASASVLHFLQRRLSSLPVVMVAAVREDATGRLDSAGAVLLRLGRLGEADAEDLLRDRHPELTDGVRARLLRESEGNPLALVDLPAQLDLAQRAGERPLPEHLALGARWERLLDRQVGALTPAERFALLLCATAGPDGGSIHLVAAAAAAAAVSGIEDDLAAVEARGLIVTEGEPPRVRIRHPLLRAFLLHPAPAAARHSAARHSAARHRAERARAERAWAAVVPPAYPVPPAPPSSPVPAEQEADGARKIARNRPWPPAPAERLGSAARGASRPVAEGKFARGGEPEPAAARLSPEELRMAELVAGGLTNREIGARLNLSPRSVASHLYRLYPKLGVTDRAAVGEALRAR